MKAKTHGRVLRGRLLLSAVVLMLSGAMLPAGQYDGGAWADPQVSGSQSQYVALWDFSAPSEYTTTGAEIDAGTVRLGTESGNGTEDFTGVEPEGSHSGTTARFHPGNLSLSAEGTGQVIQRNVTSAFKGASNVTATILLDDFSEVQLDQDEYIGVEAFETYDYPDTLTYINLSIELNSNTGGAAVAVSVNTGGGWSADLNTSWADISDTTYWIDLAPHGVDTKEELNTLKVRVYCRDPANDGGIPERLWVDQVLLWTDHIKAGDISYPTTGTYTSTVLDGGRYGEKMWDAAFWNATATGAGTSVEAQVRAGPTPQPGGEWSDWSVWYSDPAGSALGELTGSYLQYRVRLGTTDTDHTPLLTDITFTYHIFTDEGTVQTPDVTVPDIVSWDWLSTNTTLNGGTVDYWYSVDSGKSWTTLFDDVGGMNEIPIAPGKVRFMAELSAGEASTSPEVYNITMGYTRLYQPDVRVKFTSPVGSVEPGQTVTLTIRLNNSGNAPAMSPSLTLNYPSELAYKSSSVPVQAVRSEGKVKWNIADVEPGVETFTVKMTVLGGFTNGTAATLKAKLAYTDHLDNDLPTASSPDLEFTLLAPEPDASFTGDRSEAEPGESVNYTLTVTNKGGAPALDVWASATLPEGLGFGSSSPTPLSLGGAQVMWHRSNPLDPGADWKIVMRAVVEDTAEDGVELRVDGVVNYTDGNASLLPVLEAGEVTITVSAPPVVVEQSPWMVSRIPNLELDEDSDGVEVDLTKYEADHQDESANLLWYLTGEDTSLYRVSGENSTDDVITVTPEPDAWGDDMVTLVLEDSDGNTAAAPLWVNITPVNDAPDIGALPDLIVHYGVVYRFDLSYYVTDPDTAQEDLQVLIHGNRHVSFSGMNMDILYGEEETGKTHELELTVSDGELTDTAPLTVTVSDNYAPVKTGPPLATLNLTDSQFLPAAYTLLEHFTDPDGDALVFETFGHNRLEVTINPDSTVDIRAPADWSGVELLGFRAIDGSGAMAEAYTLVTIVAVNFPPVLLDMPHLQVAPGWTYDFDLSPYVSDPDTTDEQMALSTAGSLIAAPIPDAGLWISIDAPGELLGTEQNVTIAVSDGYSTVTGNLSVSVADNVPPVLLAPVPDLAFDEDTTYRDAIPLSSHFRDPEGDEAFTIEFLGGVSVGAVVEETGNVTLSASPDWYGEEDIIIRYLDSDGALREDMFRVTVSAVNDPPVLAPIPDQEAKRGEVWSLDLREYCSDVDDDFRALEFTVDTEYVIIHDGYLIFSGSASTPDEVFLNVTDGRLNASMMIAVDIEGGGGGSGTPGEEGAGEDGWLGGEGGLSVIFRETTKVVRDYSYAFLALITCIVLALLVFVYKTVYEVEEVFLIHRDKGVVIHYLSHTEDETFEKELLGSMLTAFQSFVDEAFVDEGQRGRKRTEDDMRMTEFSIGDNQKVMIEVGEHLYIALIYQGAPSRLRMRLKRIIRKLEARYGDTLDNWNGEMEPLKGTRKLISNLLTAPIYKKVRRKPAGRERTEAEAEAEAEADDDPAERALSFDMSDDEDSLLSILKEEGLEIPDTLDGMPDVKDGAPRSILSMLSDADDNDDDDDVDTGEAGDDTAGDGSVIEEEAGEEWMDWSDVAVILEEEADDTEEGEYRLHGEGVPQTGEPGAVADDELLFLPPARKTGGGLR